MDDLRALQESMLAAITGGADASVYVKGSPGLPAADRIDIYRRGYAARLLGCLRAEYPTVAALAGEQVFGLFASAYLAAHPPSTYSLFDVGAGFPAFLEDTRPRDAGPTAALPAALAILDRTRSKAMLGLIR